MLSVIKRVRRDAGVAASTWVEADKNMPNGESMARLAVCEGLSDRLFDIPRPASHSNQTFGHSVNVKIMNKGG